MGSAPFALLPFSIQICRQKVKYNITNSGRLSLKPQSAILFQDLGGYPWAIPAINTPAAQGIIEGSGPDTFHPAGEITHAQFAALLQRSLRLPQPSQSVTFTNVNVNSWEYAPVESVTPFMDYTHLPGGGNASQPNQA